MLKRKPVKILVGWLLLFFLLLMWQEGIAQPVASFTADHTSGCSPLSIQFTSTSTGAVSYFWDLGNGNSSTLANPSNLYTTPGYYTITLTAYDANGNSNVATYTNYIRVDGRPTAEFHANTTSACPDNNLFSFTNTSSGGATTYLWDFGDGNTSNDVNPLHSYTYSGIFTVTLIAINGNGCQDDYILNQYITIYPKPNPSFTVSDSIDCDPTTVFNFSSSGSNANSWEWNFGDLTTSNVSNPAHTFPGPGHYTVSLIVTNNNGCKDTSDSPTKIIVGFNNGATFSEDITSGCTPMTVQFYSPNLDWASCQWSFGDGTTSTAPSPAHIYQTGGTYSVSLMVYSTYGCADTVYKNNLIVAGTTPTVGFSNSNPAGCAPFDIQFMNTSANFDSCLWIFGDGSTSSLVNPTHTYNEGGTYSVKLLCYGSNGCINDITKNNLVSITRPKAVFNATHRIGCPPLQSSFTATSQSGPLTYTWLFGDGTVSAQQNPVHNYTTSGNFDVSLAITDANGCRDTITKSNFIQTVNTATNYIPPPVTVGCAPVTTQFTDATTGSTSWHWDFGDGSVSTLQNPSHTYTNIGTHVVTLTTSISGGTCLQTIPNFSTFQVNGGYAGFTHSDSPCPPYISTFTDTSLNASSWFWDFGDGTTDTTQNPVHQYIHPGYHSVSLHITTADGCSYTTVQNNIVYFEPFGAHFYGIALDSVFPSRVQFYANSVGATSWQWDFDDGSQSNLEDPLHTFQTLRPYNVHLTISNATCTLTYNPPPYFFGAPDSSQVDLGHGAILNVQRGCAPLNILFTNKVHNAVRWHWDFGDGDTSNIEFPNHKYILPGIYSVSLTTWDTSNAQSVLQMDSIAEVRGPLAGFSVAQNVTCASTEVIITDTSTNAVKWNWDFGDGTIDTIQNPLHLYGANRPNFIITQTVTDTFGCTASVSASIFSDFVSPLVASENEVCDKDTIYFFTSLQNFATYHWDFGDGQTSNSTNPFHIYQNPGSYNVSLTITDFNGCINTFFINPAVKVNMPVAAFTTNSPLQGCDFLNVQFTNTSLNADSYQWTFGDGNSTSIINPSHFYNRVGVYDVTLIAYKGSCSNTVNYPQYLRVDSAHAGFTFSSDKICPPITTTFTDQSANAVSWRWFFGDGDTSKLQSQVHVYIEPPVYLPGMIMTDIHGCSDTVVTGFFPNIHSGFITTADSGCFPFTVQFLSNSSGLTSEWYWDFGDGTTSTQPNPVHTYNIPGTYDITLITASPTLTTDCADTLFVPAKIKVKKPTAGFTSTDLQACAPSLVNFTNLSFDADNFLWDFGDGTKSTNQNPSHIYNTPGDYTVKLVSSSGLGCSDSITRDHFIKVLGPITNFTATPGDGCAPFVVSLNDHSINAIGYSWNFGDGYSDTILNPQHVFNDTGSFIISLVTRDTSGCTSYFELPQAVIVHPSPVSSFILNNDSGCQPLTTEFINTSTDYINSIWNFGDGDTATSTSPSHEYISPGNFDIALISFNSFGCSDTAFSSQPVEVLATPAPQFTVNDAIGCIPFHVTFVNSSANLEGPQYLWDFGNGSTSTDANPGFDFTHQGSYTISLTITNSNGCTSTVSYPSLLQIPDTLPPNETKILSVSVVSNTSVKIIWENNPALDLYSYVIYRSDASMNYFRPIYTELNSQNTNFALTSEYTDIGLNTLQYTYTYKVQAIDTCGNSIPLDQLSGHTTINISSAQSGNNILVNWTPYGGCPVSSYQLYRAEPGETFNYLTTLPGNSLSYLDSTFTCPWTYSYKVIATDLCGNTYTSNSDTSVTKPLNILARQVVDVIRSTVVDNVSVLTEWVQPLIHPEMVVQFDIYRSTDNSNFYFLESVPSLQTDYMDYNVDVQNEHYYYKILVKNTCDVNEDLSGITSTIILSGEMDDNRQVHLTWSPYEGWENGVEYYIIEKKDENGNWQLLKQINGNILKYDYQE
jgi:PKD repeat protein